MKRGRKPYETTPELRSKVESNAAVGVPETAIAKLIGCDPTTLRKYYREELDLGHIKANATVAGSLYKKCLGNGPGAVAACIFWLKTRCGWRETPTDLNINGAIDHNIKCDDAFESLASALDGLGRAKASGNLSEDEVAGNC